MICLPFKDPNQYDLFNKSINFEAEPSLAFPPNMQDIMDELGKDGAILPSPNIAILDQVEGVLNGINLGIPPFTGLPIDQQNLITGNYNFANDVRFNSYTGTYDLQFPPLLGATGGIQDVLNVLRSHLRGIPTSIPGALGSLGQANAFRSFGYLGSGNALQRNLGLGAIPDCGLLDKLFGLLKDLLQPLIDLIAAILGPLIALVAAMLAILAAILAEIFALLDLLQKLINFANSGFLLRLDPCSLLGLGKIGSPGLRQQVNTGIEWVNPDAPQIPDPGDVF
jgi:hypothetical protein